jgi:hypothetical protein
LFRKGKRKKKIYTGALPSLSQVHVYQSISFILSRREGEKEGKEGRVVGRMSVEGEGRKRKEDTHARKLRCAERNNNCARNYASTAFYKRHAIFSLSPLPPLPPLPPLLSLPSPSLSPSHEWHNISRT